jgi:hypothetical protein
VRRRILCRILNAGEIVSNAVSTLSPVLSTRVNIPARTSALTKHQLTSPPNRSPSKTRHRSQEPPPRCLPSPLTRCLRSRSRSRSRSRTHGTLLPINTEFQVQKTNPRPRALCFSSTGRRIPDPEIPTTGSPIRPGPVPAPLFSPGSGVRGAGSCMRCVAIRCAVARDE